MKWYSIKEYTPPACEYVLIRALKKDGGHDWYFVAMIDDFTKIFELNAWEFNYGRVGDCVNEYNVTHFCILDPIPVDKPAQYATYRPDLNIDELRSAYFTGPGDRTL